MDEKTKNLVCLLLTELDLEGLLWNEEKQQLELIKRVEVLKDHLWPTRINKLRQNF